MRTRVAWIVALAVAVVAAGSTARAELFMKQTRHTDAFTVQGYTQPEQNEIVTYWFGKDRVRTDGGDAQSAIVMLDRKIAYFLDHGDKTYAEIPIDLEKVFQAGARAEGGKDSAKAKEEFDKAVESMAMGMEVKVTETAETKKIKDWNCRKYVVDFSMPMGKSRSELWTTADTKVDDKAYWTAANAMMAAQPWFEKVFAEMKKIKGVVVYNVTTTDVMGVQVKTTEEVVEIAERQAPGGTFEVPKDYKKTEGMMMK